MKKLLALILAFAVVFTFAACGGDTSGSGDEEAATEDQAVELRFGTYHDSEGNKFVQFDNQFIDLVSEYTNGTVTITPYWSSTLLGVENAYSETLEGISDITCGSPGYETEHFVIDNAINFFYYNSASYADNFDMMYEIFEAVPEWQAEWEGVEVFHFSNAIGTSMQILSKEPIRSLADLKGKQIRCTEQSVFELIQELGGTPVRMPFSEAYDSLSKGIIDGIVNVPTTLVQMADICKYRTELNFMAPMCIWTYISDDAMAKMSEDQQEAVLKAGHEAEEQATIAFIEQSEKDIEPTWEENNVEYITLSDDDYAKINEAWDTIAKRKAEELNGLGYDGTGIYEKCREIVEKYE